MPSNDRFDSPSSYHKSIDSALDDAFLRRTLDTFAISYRAGRKAIFSEVDERGLIRQIADAKDQACQHMEELYAQFREEAQKRGAVVHRAATAADANEIIARIARDNDVHRVIKSKSMTAEEIRLNKRLEEDGLVVDETDLGEWIIQLRHEGPSHMVLPAIHLSRQQVADDFARATGEAQDTDIQRLVKVARVQLRRKFISADMGVSGCNFAVAENGAVTLVTNEGNAEMVTTLPRVHVVLVGLDKLVPTLDVALTALQVLPRNATAQRITSYVTFIDGATACAADPTGKKQLHIVFLDNGRSAIAKDPLFSQIFRCVRCGACANVCPVFRLVGGHRMGYVYIGAIGLILTYFFHGHDKAAILSQNCIGCEACKDVCAGGIDLPRLIREVRARLVKQDGAGAPETLLAAVMKNRKLFHNLIKFASFAQRPFVTGNQDGTTYLRHLPAIFMGKHQYKALPAIAAESFRDRWQRIRPSLPAPRMRIALFSGCAQDFIYPEQLEAFVKLMTALNVAVDFPLEQTCCGLPLDVMGQRPTAVAVARQNVEAFARGGYDAIVTLCASCASHIRNVYPELLDGDALSQGARAMAEKTQPFSLFMHDTLGVTADDFARTEETVTFHAPCHLCRGCGVTEQPHDLVNYAASFVPCAEEDVCCGFGGSYSMKFPEVAAQLLENKIAHVRETGAQRLVTDCPGCVLQIRGGARKHELPIRVSHLVELLAETVKPRS
ncbi:L-lactate dehydrogenase (quinone) large subunit LdhH [uncultured Desulfovibrio sp.]|uniref:L-lactate dehydrogenase (quinone) large subunit LdhH n=1 Tax=uncultured Desulfovibrio sp. TaxID=167968 RepID=UPI00260735D0|nr:LUD domain-containing protein [uncultured Desulfovibrio sp.]